MFYINKIDSALKFLCLKINLDNASKLSFLNIIPLNFKKAIIEPEKVMHRLAAPIDISIKLASLIFPDVPKLNTEFKDAFVIKYCCKSN